jgi:hypothetical protein
MRTVWRAEVPVDDREHQVTMPLSQRAPLMRVEARTPHIVEAWFEVDTDALAPITYVMRVFGTGQPIPDEWAWLGTCLAAGGQLVWHLYHKPARAGAEK